MLGCQQGTGRLELTEIEDIQLETCTTFSSIGDDTTPTAAMRHWVSLIKGDERGRPQACSEDKEYTAKCGDDYFLNYCFSL